jgi:signal transduction histidine kinase
MNAVDIIWSAVAGACLMMAVINLMVWIRKPGAWEHLFYPLTLLGALGILVAELVSMNACDPATYVSAVRWAQLATLLATVGVLGFVHFYFGTGRVRWLMVALGLRLLAVLANFTTGENIQIRSIESLRQIPFLGTEISVLDAWEPNRWMILAQVASLVLVAYVVDAALRLWRTGTPDGRRRAVIVGGGLALFFVAGSGQANLVAAGVLEMPFLVSFAVLGSVLAMGYELSRDVLQSMQRSLDRELSEKRLRQVIEAAPSAMVLVDVSSRILLVNEQVETVFGHTRGELLGASIRTLVPAWPDPRPPGGPAATTGGSELDGRRKDGSKVPLELRMNPIESQDEPLFLVSIHDIGARKQAEFEASRQQLELAHLSRVSTLGQLAGALAHELNQPLAAILGNSQVGGRMLGEAEPDLTEISAILEDVASDAKRAGGIIHGMRAMLKKTMVTDVVPVDLNQEALQVMDLLHGEIVHRNVEVELVLAADLPMAAAGRVELQQVLMNLVLNGLDAMDHGGRDRRLVVRTCARDGEVSLSIRDGGPGIAAEIIDRLFEPFVSTKPGGLGLGLTISRGIVERFRGRLLAGNEAGGGARFELLLPAIRA